VKKSNTKGYILHNFISIIFLQRQNYTETNSVVARGLEREISPASRKKWDGSGEEATMMPFKFTFQKCHNSLNYLS
jgi:hypothetical protein